MRKKKFFWNIDELHDIFIAYNRLESLPNSFKRMPKRFLMLFLQNNCFTKVPEVLNELRLGTLDISGNPIDSFPEKISNVTKYKKSFKSTTNGKIRVEGAYFL